jgi:diguanylate cyclase (GGDEF)-like protein
LETVPGHERILVVDDSKTQLDWLVGVLKHEGYEVRTASDGREAIQAARTDPPDLILLDRILPDMDGMVVVRDIKARLKDHFVPVILLSAKADLDSRVKGLQIGADDFLAKPFAEAEIIARCGAMLRIKKLQDELLRTKAELEIAKRAAEEQSITDGLTGLRNRRFFDERLVEEFKRAQRYTDQLSLMMIDLDHFKLVNDKYGHQAGDVVLRDTAGLIRASIRDPDIACRYGGEEFAIILPKTHLSGALSVAERIWRELGGKTFPVGGGLKLTGSIGIAFYPAKDITAPELLVRFADEALYQAKKSGRNTICLYQAQAYRYEAAKR